MPCLYRYLTILKCIFLGKVLTFSHFFFFLETCLNGPKKTRFRQRQHSAEGNPGIHRNIICSSVFYSPLNFFTTYTILGCRVLYAKFSRWPRNCTVCTLCHRCGTYLMTCIYILNLTHNLTSFAQVGAYYLVQPLIKWRSTWHLCLSCHCSRRTWTHTVNILASSTPYPLFENIYRMFHSLLLWITHPKKKC